jgi:hypothetical protein
MRIWLLIDHSKPERLPLLLAEPIEGEEQKPIVFARLGEPLDRGDLRTGHGSQLAGKPLGRPALASATPIVIGEPVRRNTK